MRMSCNGCRVLRKGCNESCSIRPCLEWIKSAESQANATVFLAKFYGRAGLINLLNAGPSHLRPAIFRSLFYESCGRIVNPIYGSVGLLWSGQWQLCQNAVDAVLKGHPITPIATEAAAGAPPMKGYDIRHVIKDDENSNSVELHRVKPNRVRFKRSRVTKPKPTKEVVKTIVSELIHHDEDELNGSSTSHESTVSHPDEATEDTSMVSVEVSHMGVDPDMEEREYNDMGLGLELDLTLGFGFNSSAKKVRNSEPESCWASDELDRKMNLRLD